MEDTSYHNPLLKLQHLRKQVLKKSVIVLFEIISLGVLSLPPDFQLLVGRNLISNYL